jgi:hypothetical protein
MAAVAGLGIFCLALAAILLSVDPASFRLDLSLQALLWAAIGAALVAVAYSRRHWRPPGIGDR